MFNLKFELLNDIFRLKRKIIRSSIFITFGVTQRRKAAHLDDFLSKSHYNLIRFYILSHYNWRSIRSYDPLDPGPLPSLSIMATEKIKYKNLVQIAPVSISIDFLNLRAHPIMF